MPARGRHRRYKPGPVSRASLTVTAGGAGLALPLVSAGVGHAASADAERTVHAERTQRAQQSPVAALQTRLQTQKQTRAEATARAGHGAEDASYEVVGGDTLSSIAREHEVDGGWQGLYAHNRRVVGDDPDLILPGQRLSLEQRATSRERPDAREKAREQRDTEPAPERSAPPEQDKQQPEPAPASQAPQASAPVAGDTGTPYRAAGSGWSSGYHTGVDFPVPTGTTVRAVSAGTVVSAGWAGAYGYQVVLRHDDGRYSQYAHLSAISVADGRRVNAGQRVGRSGSTGNSTGPHLHFEVRTGPGYGSDIDPLAYLRRLGVTV